MINRLTLPVNKTRSNQAIFCMYLVPMPYPMVPIYVVVIIGSRVRCLRME
jgi:hypothetical protein